MLEVIVFAAALYVCPGDVYTDTPKAGCHPLQESNKEGFGTVPERPESDSKATASGQTEPGKFSDGQLKIPSVSPQECAMYEEWVKLSTKSGSLGARDLSADEFERWTNLKQVFGNSPPPNCQ
jgi:hypothetical protein